MLPKKLTTLVAEYRAHESKLRADFQQYYGIDFDNARAGEHTAWHMACLLVELPTDARIRISENADAIWTFDNILTATLINSFSYFRYNMADPKRRGNPPDLLGPSWLTEKDKKSLPTRSMPANELLRILSLPREVESWQQNP